MGTMAVWISEATQNRIMNSADPFEVLVGEHYEALFRFAISLTQSESDARDLTQQTFYVWATKGNQLRDSSKVKTWLFTTLHRAFLQMRRRQVRFPHHELEGVSSELPALFHNFADRLDAAHVVSALAKVDDIYEGAVALFYLEDCSYAEISEILEVPIGTVKSRISRGIAQLKEILLSADDGLPRSLSQTRRSCGDRGSDCFSAVRACCTHEGKIRTGALVPVPGRNHSASFNSHSHV